MREKRKNWNPVLVFILGVAIAAGFLLVMDGATFLASWFMILPGYGMTVVSELTASVYILIVLLALGYIGVFAKMGEGLLTGFYIGGFMTSSDSFIFRVCQETDRYSRRYRSFYLRLRCF